LPRKRVTELPTNEAGEYHAAAQARKGSRRCCPLAGLIEDGRAEARPCIDAGSPLETVE